jgi:hypothetical protein
MSNNADLTAVIAADISDFVQGLEKGFAEMKNFGSGIGDALHRLDQGFDNTFTNIKNILQETKTAFLAFAPIAIFDLPHDQLEKGIKDWTAIGDAADKAAVSTDFSRRSPIGPARRTSRRTKLRVRFRTSPNRWRNLNMAGASFTTSGTKITRR